MPIAQQSNRPHMAAIYKIILASALMCIIAAATLLLWWQHASVQTAQQQLNALLTLQHQLNTQATHIERLMATTHTHRNAIQSQHQNFDAVLQDFMSQSRHITINQLLLNIDNAHQRLIKAFEQSRPPSPTLASPVHDDASLVAAQQALWGELKALNHAIRQQQQAVNTASIFPAGLLVLLILSTLVFMYVWLLIASLRQSSREPHNTQPHQKNTSREAQAKFKKLARFDPLTELPNRFLFQETLSKLISDANSKKNTLALMYVDLDHFKNVNDSLGHEAGDILLQLATNRFKNACRQNDFIARLGGDEFAVILPDVDDLTHVSEVANRIIKNLKQPFILHGNKAHISTSIGIATYRYDKPITVKQLVRYADLAMYKAKTEGRDAYQFFTPQLDNEMSRHVLIKEALHNAIANNELNVLFQPQVNATTTHIHGFEVLLRWHNEKLGQVSPAEFIPIAEESALILDIGWWVINETIKQLQTWSIINPRLMEQLHFSLNLSAAQVAESDFVEKIVSLVSQNGLSHRNITLEVTETALIKNPEKTSKILAELKTHGFQISIDDFGTGYSSLTFLQDFPIDELKIDYKFVSSIVNDKESANIVKAIISMAKILDMDIVAEGVETKEQVDYLTTYGCYIMQGFYYMPAIDRRVFTQALENMKNDALQSKQIRVAQLRQNQSEPTPLQAVV